MAIRQARAQLPRELESDAIEGWWGTTEWTADRLRRKGKADRGSEEGMAYGLSIGERR